MTDQTRLWQVSLPRAVSRGFVAPLVRVGEVLEHGDTGIGAMAETGGLAVLCDGVCHAYGKGGTVREVRSHEQLCQVTVGKFDHYAPVFLTSGIKSVRDLTKALEARSEVAKGRNSFHLAVATGTFGRVVLSGPKAYQSGEGVAATEAAGEPRDGVVELADVSGRIVGTRRPAYLEPSGRICWRFALLSEDGRVLGHLLGLSGASLACQICRYDAAELHLPPAKAFSKVDMD